MSVPFTGTHKRSFSPHWGTTRDIKAAGIFTVAPCSLPGDGTREAEKRPTEQGGGSRKGFSFTLNACGNVELRALILDGLESVFESEYI